MKNWCIMREDDDDLDKIKNALARMETAITYIKTQNEKELNSHSKQIEDFDSRLRAAEKDLGIQKNDVSKHKEDINKIDGHVQTLQYWKWFISGALALLGVLSYYGYNIIISLIRSGYVK